MNMEESSSASLNRTDILVLLKKEYPIIRERYGVARIGLFGSYARDEAEETSDIDLLVAFEEGKERFRSFMQCIFYLEELFGRRVEMIVDHALDYRIRSSVEREVIWV